MTYITIPYPDQPPEPPITNVRNETKLSIDLFGGKEASGQFRYLVRHYQGSTSRSRIMTSQIDKLIIKGQQMRAETDHYKYFLLLQVVEGQNGKYVVVIIISINRPSVRLTSATNSTPSLLRRQDRKKNKTSISISQSCSRNMTLTRPMKSQSTYPWHSLDHNWLSRLWPCSWRHASPGPQLG